MDTMSIMSPDSKGLGKPMHSRLSVVMQMSPMIMPHSRHSRMQSPADLSLPSVDTPGASFGQEAHHVCTIFTFIQTHVRMQFYLSPTEEDLLDLMDS